MSDRDHEWNAYATDNNADTADAHEAFNAGYAAAEARYMPSLNTAEANRDRLRAVIENAPHDSLCNYRVDEIGASGKCSCWKADAL